MDGDGTGRNARGVRGKTRLELGDLLQGELADAMSLILVRLGGEADDVLRRARPVQHLAAPFAPRPQDVGVRPAVSRVRVRNARRRTPRTTRTKCFSSSSARRRPPRRGSRAVESRAEGRTARELRSLSNVQIADGALDDEKGPNWHYHAVTLKSARTKTRFPRSGDPRKRR